MPETFLDFSSIPEEDGDVDFNWYVARALGLAYQQLRQQKYFEALITLKPHLVGRMSARQFVRVRYIRGFAWLQLSQFVKALESLDEAYVRVQRMGNLGAKAQLAYLLGTAHYYSNGFKNASLWYRIALDAWHNLDIAPDKITLNDLAFEVDTLVGLGLQHLWLAHYEDAEHSFCRAGALVTMIPNSAGQAARIDWNLALIERWRGNLSGAYVHAQAALNIYEQGDALNATSRLRTVMADIWLDIAERYSSDQAASSRVPLLMRAEKHLERAKREARHAQDEASEGMALLSYARYLRVTNDQNSNRLSPVENAGQIAIGRGDRALLGQSFAGRGDEFALAGRIDAAKTAYGNAIDVLTQSGVPALAKWPLRALLKMQEVLV